MRCCRCRLWSGRRQLRLQGTGRPSSSDWCERSSSRWAGSHPLPCQRPLNLSVPGPERCVRSADVLPPVRSVQIRGRRDHVALRNCGEVRAVGDPRPEQAPAFP